MPQSGDQKAEGSEAFWKLIVDKYQNIYVINLCFHNR